MATKPNIPVNREEMYLDVMTGGSSSLPAPVTIGEKYLAKIAGMQVDVPTYTTGLPRIYAYLAKAAGQDFEVPQPITREEMYWFDYVNGQPTPSEQEYTGAVPVTFTADGQPLLDYLISGNTVQSGTPTPDNPIMPQGTGDLETVGVKAGQYKIPISSAGQTTPIYLGEVETTRKIKKAVFKGDETENWGYSSSGNNARVYLAVDSMAESPSISTHYKFGAIRPYPNLNEYCINSASALVIGVDINSITSAADFKSYLAAQYAAGTPVCVWYVLSTSQTAVVNEPLMKIGDYADTLSMEQAGLEIPTVNGNNILDVLTTVKPSEVYIKYKGKPVAGSQTSSQSSVYAPAEVSDQSENVDDINSSLLGKEEETE